jgi:hypothetical protein
MRKLLISFVCVLALSASIVGSHFTTAQETPATPGARLVCGTPAASPEASATPILVVEGTPIVGMGAVVASPGTTVGDECAPLP